MLLANAFQKPTEQTLSSKIFLSPSPNFFQSSFLILFAQNGFLSSQSILDLLGEPKHLFQALEQDGFSSQEPQLIISSEKKSDTPRYIYLIPKTAFPVQSSVDLWSLQLAKTLFGLKQKQIGLYIPKGLISVGLQYQILFEMIRTLASYHELPDFYIYKGASSYHEWLSQLLYLKKDLKELQIHLEIFH